MTLDQLLTQVADRGLRVANLFQYQLPEIGDSAGDWKWQANLTDGLQAWEFGRADTPEGALLAALAALSQPGVPRRPQPSSHQIEPSATSSPPLPVLNAEEVMI